MSTVFFDVSAAEMDWRESKLIHCKPSFTSVVLYGTQCDHAEGLIQDLELHWWGHFFPLFLSLSAKHTVAMFYLSVFSRP